MKKIDTKSEVIINNLYNYEDVVSRNNLKDFIKDENGRNKIIADIVGTRGVVYGVVENEGHIQALYQKENSEHTWKLPVTIFEPILIGVL